MVPPTSSLARGTVLGLLLVLATALPAAAQSPEAYAVEYATFKAGWASEDPEGFAANHSSPDDVGRESEHALWLSCWAAHEEGAGGSVQPVCEGVYQPPNEQRNAVEADAQADEGAADGAGEAARELAGHAGELVQRVAGEPEQAPQHLGDFLRNVLDWMRENVLQRILGGADVALEASVGGVLGTVNALHRAGDAAASGAGAAANGAARAVASVVDAVRSLVTGALEAAVASVAGAGDAVRAGFDAAAHGFDALRADLVELLGPGTSAPDAAPSAPTDDVARDLPVDGLVGDAEETLERASRSGN